MFCADEMSHNLVLDWGAEHRQVPGLATAETLAVEPTDQNA